MSDDELVEAVERYLAGHDAFPSVADQLLMRLVAAYREVKRENAMLRDANACHLAALARAGVIEGEEDE